jgi:hypothetical protein
MEFAQPFHLALACRRSTAESAPHFRPGTASNGVAGLGAGRRLSQQSGGGGGESAPSTPGSSGIADPSRVVYVADVIDRWVDLW